MCEEDTSLFEWCTHEGHAEFYRPSEDYYDLYESISTDESIVIPEARGGSFEFKVEHTYDIYETYYPNDHTLNGDVVFFVGDKESTFKRKSDEDTHYYENGYYYEYKICRCLMTR